MGREQYQANWRGARKYRFDEEFRHKQAARTWDTQPRIWPVWALVAAVGAALLIGTNERLLLGTSCTINYSGERTYHIRGQHYYDDTRISMWRGERWFCSETEAHNAGWRRSKV